MAARRYGLEPLDLSVQRRRLSRDRRGRLQDARDHHPLLQHDQVDYGENIENNIEIVANKEQIVDIQELDPLHRALLEQDEPSRQEQSKQPLAPKTDDSKRSSLPESSIKFWDAEWFEASANSMIANTLGNNLKLNDALATYTSKLTLNNQEELRRLRITLLDSTMGAALIRPEELPAFSSVLKAELWRMWRQERRVQALKLVIEVAKAIEDTSQMDAATLACYPQLFFCLSEVIALFGQLVHDRLVLKCQEEGVTAESKELCRNWSLKILSIRELGPRLYLELSFLRCYGFLEDPRFSSSLVLDRISKSIRGITDPLAAAALRTFHAKIAQTVMDSHTSNLSSLLMEDYTELVSSFRRNVYRFADIVSLRNNDYIELFRVFVHLLLKAVCEAEQENLQDKNVAVLLEDFGGSDNRISSLLLAELINCCSPNFALERCEQICALLKRAVSEDTYYSCSRALINFGVVLNKSDEIDLKENKRLAFECVLGIVKNVENVEDVLEIAEAWLQLSLSHLTLATSSLLMLELEQLLLSSDSSSWSSKSVSAKMAKLINAIISVSARRKRVFDLTTQTNLFRMLEMLDTTTRSKVASETLKFILEELMATNKLIKSFNEAKTICVLANYMAEESLHAKEDRTQDSSILCSALGLVSIDDLEQQLRFYVEMRRCCWQLESVQVSIVSAVNAKAINQIAGRHFNNQAYRKRIAQACCAFVYINLPTLQSQCNRLRLSLCNAQTAMALHCIHLAEANLKYCLKQLLETNEDWAWHQYLPNYMSLVLIMPNHQQLIKAALAAIKTNEVMEKTLRSDLLMRTLRLLATTTWKKYPYHIEGLVSNDVLCNENAEYTEEMINLGSDVLNDLIELLPTLEETIALDLLQFICFCSKFDENSKELAEMIWTKELRNSEKAHKWLEDVEKNGENEAKHFLQILREKCT